MSTNACRGVDFRVYHPACVPALTAAPPTARDGARIPATRRWGELDWADQDARGVWPWLGPPSAFPATSFADLRTLRTVLPEHVLASGAEAPAFDLVQ